MKNLELKQLLRDNDIELSEKAKKADLMSLVAESILNGSIPTEEDEESEEEEEAEPASVDGEDSGEETDVVPEEDATEDGEEYEVSEEREKAEDEIIEAIDAEIESGKLTSKKMKAFLEKYYEGNADCSKCKGCSSEELVDCYKDAKVSFVGDEGEVNEEGNPYIRNEMYFCCGRECKELENGNIFCEICGEEFELED